MFRTCVAWTAAIALLTALAFAGVDRQQPLVQPDEAIALFNGENLDGLYTWLGDTGYDDPRDVFTVADGQIRISGDGFGYLATERAYRDYRLVVEFRWGDRNWRHRVGKARDAGIFLHSVGPDGNSYDGDGAFRAAIECQVMEGATGDLMLIRGHDADGEPIPTQLTADVADERDDDGWYTWQPAGEPVTITDWGRLNWRNKSDDWADEFGFRGEHDVASPPGEWTRVECVAEGDRISVYVNGELVNQARAVQPRAGAILLQCEGSEIFIRRFELRPLGE